MQVLRAIKEGRNQRRTRRVRQLEVEEPSFLRVRAAALLVLAFAPLPALIAAYGGPEQSQRERTLLDRWASER